MNSDLLIRKEAQPDIKDGFAYYESCRPHLGHDFLLCVEESLEKIRRNPELYKYVHKNIRRILVRRFPFGIYFLNRQDKTLVIAVMHARKNPSRWQARAPS